MPPLILPGSDEKRNRKHKCFKSKVEEKEEEVDKCIKQLADQAGARGKADKCRASEEDSRTDSYDGDSFDKKLLRVKTNEDNQGMIATMGREEMEEINKRKIKKEEEMTQTQAEGDRRTVPR